VGDEVYDVFVSYARWDWPHAADIVAALRARGLKSFFDRSSLPPGLPWVQALEQAIGASKSVVVLIGPSGFGNTLSTNAHSPFSVRRAIRRFQSSRWSCLKQHSIVGSIFCKS
jgi:hypothetical protein